jgi:hypothetical protein
LLATAIDVRCEVMDVLEVLEVIDVFELRTAGWEPCDSRSTGNRDAATALTGVDGLTLVLGQAPPHAVRLAYGQCVLPALLDDGAAGTDRLRSGVPVAARRAALTLGVEEEGGIGVAAGTL